VRLDKLLWFLRLTRTRSIAQAVIGAGHVRIDGRPTVRGSQDIQPGQVITLPLHDRVRILRVTALPSRRGPAAEAQSCYDDLSPARD
jgi:ribosome-associated heat shock protein Hsp15